MNVYCKEWHVFSYICILFNDDFVGVKRICFYIGIEDLPANALIEVLKEPGKRFLTYYELENYGEKVFQILEERGGKAVLILSRDFIERRERCRRSGTPVQRISCIGCSACVYESTVDTSPGSLGMKEYKRLKDPIYEYIQRNNKFHIVSDRSS